MSRPTTRTSFTPQRPTASEVVVREGFICPICMQDLGTIDELQEHFERDHTEEDKTLLQQLKGAFPLFGNTNNIRAIILINLSSWLGKRLLWVK